MWTSYAQCNPQRQVLRVSRVMKLLKTGCVPGCDWTANGRRSRHNGGRGCATHGRGHWKGARSALQDLRVGRLHKQTRERPRVWQTAPRPALPCASFFSLSWRPASIKRRKLLRAITCLTVQDCCFKDAAIGTGDTGNQLGAARFEDQVGGLSHLLCGGSDTLHVGSRRSASVRHHHSQLYALEPLQGFNYGEQVAGLRIARGSEHLH